ncbi:hypothetical protein HN832_02770 [archaeon]|nr:hypothetical protein [archaeon]MBT4373278.1 hypothetical protein [archaeon]MBT4531623.1 hypothetical protein [archaeon]MBT7001199.1 hypothetical protein [archaeon]MBT7282315.1 hypothetical protein [archaeon]
MNETKNVRARLILEVIGKPPEHLTATLEGLIKKMSEEKGVKIIGEKIKEPVLMKDSKEFYTTFAEIEIEVEEVLLLAELMFKYMPAHIEIISPEFITLENNGWNEILNELVRKLHGYDEVARVLQMQSAKMQRRIRELEEKYEPKKENSEEKK